MSTQRAVALPVARNTKAPTALVSATPGHKCLAGTLQPSPAEQVRQGEVRVALALARHQNRMGTSIALLGSTYGHLVPDSEEHIRTLLDAGDRERLGHVRAKTPER
jgi:hypothetical protein